MNRVYLSVLVALCCFISVFNWRFLCRDATPLLFDENMYYDQACMIDRAADWFWRGGRTDGCFRKIFEQQYSPFVPFLVFITCSIFGFEQDVACMVQSPFLLILMFSLYGLGSRLYGRACGFCAVLILLSFPFVTAMSRVLYLDLPLTALVTSSLWALFASEYFTHRRNSFLFGLAFALAILVKIQAVFFVGGPLALVLWQSLRRPESRTRAYGNIAASAAAFALLCAPLYALLLPEIVSQYGKLFRAPSEISRPPALYAMLDYAHYLYERLLLPLFFGIFVAALPLFFLRIKRGRRFLLAWLSVPYVIFSLLSIFYVSRATRFYMPCLPAAALIISAAAFSFRGRVTRTVALCLLAASSLWTHWYLYNSYGGKHALACADEFHHGEGRYRVRKEDWKTEEIIDVIAREAERKGRVVVLPLYHNDMINSPLRMWMTEKGPKTFVLDDYVNFFAGGYEDLQEEEFYRQRVAKADVVLVKGGDIGPVTRTGRLSKALKRLLAAVSADRGLRLVRQLKVADGSSLKIYSRQGAQK